MVIFLNHNALQMTASKPQSAAGVTLLEMAMAMMIIAVVSVGVSGIIKVGAEHNLSERQHQTMQIMAMNVVDDLRFDLHTADTINNLGGGSNTLVINGNGKVITYTLNTNNHQLTRLDSQTNATKIYNDPNIFMSNMQFSCQSGGAATPCFQKDPSAGVATNGTPKALMIPNLTVTAVLPAGSAGTVIDQVWGAPTFKLNQFSFNIAAATEFK